MIIKIKLLRGGDLWAGQPVKHSDRSAFKPRSTITCAVPYKTSIQRNQTPMSNNCLRKNNLKILTSDRTKLNLFPDYVKKGVSKQVFTRLKALGTSDEEGGYSSGAIQGVSIVFLAAIFLVVDLKLRDEYGYLVDTSPFWGGLKHVLDGLVAGGTGAALVYPIDVLKTRLQSQTDGRYDGPLDCFQKVLKEEGLGGLYAGIIPQIVGVSPEKGLKVTIYSFCKPALLASPIGAFGWFLPSLLSGFAAGACQVSVTNPLEVTKIRLQLQAVEGTSQPVGEIIRELGLPGLYQGALVTASRDVPSVAVFFVCYEAMKLYLSNNGTIPLGPTDTLLAGLLAGIPSAASVTPMDVVKTRWQAKGGTKKYKSPIDVLKRSVEEEGIMVLTTGWLPRCLRIAPQLAITLTVFEWLAPGSGH